MLELVVFLCGAALMGLEFIAARLLAPALGSSLFVWGSVISIVMVALSLGYWVGGQIADRVGSVGTLPVVIAVAGLFTVTVPWLTSVVLPAVAVLGARAGSLMASGIIFFAPSLMLAMVSPLGVRLATGDRIDRVGRSAGQLYAISTAGSIVGTIATAFWLIPLLTLDGLTIGIGLLLFGTSVFALGLGRHYPDRPTSATIRSARRSVAPTLAVAALGVVIATATLLAAGQRATNALPGERILLRTDTQYHRLIVSEDDEVRTLRFDRSRQSNMYLADPFDTEFDYPDYLHLALAAKPDARSVLIVGLGGGSLVKRMWQDYPQMRIDVVEIDPVVVDVAYKYFELPRDDRIRVFIEDGRRFLASNDRRYDIIFMDAYYADALPSHLTTQEFFSLLEERLAPGGVLAYNVIGAVQGDASRLFRSMYRTAGRVWRTRWVFPIGISQDHEAERNRNIIVIATDNRTSRESLLGRIANRAAGRVMVEDFEKFGEDLYDAPIPTSDVPVLTDAHAPTDTLIQVN